MGLKIKCEAWTYRDLIDMANYVVPPSDFVLNTDDIFQIRRFVKGSPDLIYEEYWEITLVPHDKDIIDPYNDYHHIYIARSDVLRLVEVLKREGRVAVDEEVVKRCNFPGGYTEDVVSEVKLINRK